MTGEWREPLLLYRALRFRRFTTCLSELVLNGLNRAIECAGTRLGFKTRIVVLGLPDLADIDRAIADVSTGSVAYADLWDIASGLVDSAT